VLSHLITVRRGAPLHAVPFLFALAVIVAQADCDCAGPTETGKDGAPNGSDGGPRFPDASTADASFGSCTGCAASMCCSAGTCVASLTEQCGASGSACNDCNGAVANANGIACSAGSCTYAVCLFGFLDCDGNKANGCETNPAIDPFNCGSCGKRCAGNPNGRNCINGVCG
jgi:hypothetical protein